MVKWFLQIRRIFKRKQESLQNLSDRFAILKEKVGLDPWYASDTNPSSQLRSNAHADWLFLRPGGRRIPSVPHRPPTGPPMTASIIRSKIAPISPTLTQIPVDTESHYIKLHSGMRFSLIRKSHCKGGKLAAEQTLFGASVGCDFQVVALKGCEATCHRLREMGFCEQARVRKITAGGNTVCTVCGSRVALSKKLAESIVVA